MLKNGSEKAMSEQTPIKPAGPGILWSIEDWARAWGLAEMKAHQLRKHPDFPGDAEVVLGARCVRFRSDRLADFAALLATAGTRIEQPERLRRGVSRRAEARNERDAAASWIGNPGARQ